MRRLFGDDMTWILGETQNDLNLHATHAKAFCIHIVLDQENFLITCATRLLPKARLI